MFLATTAIEEFWDKNQKILFLGEWCKLFVRKKEWMSLEYEDVPFVWENTDTVLNGIKYCNEVYEKTLLELAQILNAYHGINKDAHYYRIILGNWLIHFIHQLYDKYLTLKKAFEKYPVAQTCLLDENQFYIPLEYNDYNTHIVNDKYALQLYSQIIISLGYNFDKKKLKKPIELQLSYHNKVTNNSRFHTQFARKVLFFIATSFHKKNITLTTIFSSRKMYLKLLIKSGFRCIYDAMEYKVRINFEIDNVVRKKIMNLNGDEFESVLSKTLLFNIPFLFVEGFATFRRAVMRLPTHQSKAFYVTNHLQWNNILKFFLAEHYQTIKILNMQHGGGYGVDFINITEEYEKSVSDVFYTAGWKKKAKTIPLSIPKFRKREPLAAPSTDNILFTMNEMPRYVYRLCFQAMAASYLKEIIRYTMVFLTNFQRRDKLLIRSYPQHINGWDTCERIAECYPDCSFDDFSKPFDQRLFQAKIFLSNCAHTTYLEALAINKPTVVLISNKIVRFHPDAQPYFDRLQEVNILHYSPKSAAEHLNAIYDDLDTWWQSNKVQEARIAFVTKYARCMSNWAKEWSKEFRSVLSEC